MDSPRDEFKYLKCKLSSRDGIESKERLHMVFLHIEHSHTDRARIDMLLRKHFKWAITETNGIFEMEYDKEDAYKGKEVSLYRFKDKNTYEKMKRSRINFMRDLDGTTWKQNFITWLPHITHPKGEPAVFKEVKFSGIFSNKESYCFTFSQLNLL